uniref:LAGLIDADG homing endonuclease n=1 Tax=Romanomermis culicivorax TaxID=13658 RepID=A0A915KVD7_ROMCU
MSSLGGGAEAAAAGVSVVIFGAAGGGGSYTKFNLKIVLIGQVSFVEKITTSTMVAGGGISRPHSFLTTSATEGVVVDDESIFSRRVVQLSMFNSNEIFEQLICYKAFLKRKGTKKEPPTKSFTQTVYYRIFGVKNGEGQLSRLNLGSFIDRFNTAYKLAQYTQKLIGKHRTTGRYSKISKTQCKQRAKKAPKYYKLGEESIPRKIDNILSLLYAHSIYFLCCSCSLAGPSYGAGSFSAAASAPQISRAYSFIVRSDENLPLLAMLCKAIRVHRSVSCFRKELHSYEESILMEIAKKSLHFLGGSCIAHVNEAEDIKSPEL